MSFICFITLYVFILWSNLNVTYNYTTINANKYTIVPNFNFYNTLLTNHF